jgi:hypothetical protein
VIGKIVAIANHHKKQAIGVVASVDLISGTARVLVYSLVSNRWHSPLPYPVSDLSDPPEDWPHVAKARASIRSHYGVIPCGGTFGTRVRVWPDGREPDQRAS